jgi:NAD(P)-dependent dehydrogenase (short-subunit alcohol dehydrogenase family)
MKISTLIVFGSTSSIAKAILTELDVKPSRIFSFDRVRPNQKINEYIPESNQSRIDWDNINEIESFVISRLTQNISDPVLILNFMGYFGNIESVDDLDIDDALLTNSKNLTSFLLIAKIARFLPTDSRIISFSGAGVGGDNLDDSSLGYLAAKASMAVLTEAIDQQLQKHGVRFGLISPGAFPSRMQEVVSKESSDKIPEKRVLRAKEVMTSTPSTKKLVDLIEFLAENPQQLGGRTWSANFDNLTDQIGNFGKLRRIY